MIRFRSIFVRHLVSHLLVILLLALVTVELYIHLYSNGSVLHSRVKKIADYLAAETETKQIVDLQTLHLLSNLSNTVLWISDTDGNVIGGTPPEDWPQNYSLSSQTSDKFMPLSAIFAVPTKIFISVPTKISGKPAILYAYQDRESIPIFAGRWTFYIFMIGILPAAALEFFLSRNLTKDITNIAMAAARFSSGDRDSRITTCGGDELGDLGRNFNTMADSIKRTEQTRREFYANVSHELKTPLSCVQATTEALMDGIAKTPEDYQQYLQNIQSETLRMTRMIRDLLDMEQLEAGNLNYCREHVDIRILLSQQADKIQDLLKTKSLSLRLRLEASKHFIWGDTDRLTQVFDNLLSNAIRHSPQGSCINIVMVNDKNNLKISISDQGEGISPDELPFIWDRFYRTDKSRARASGGSGLGLSITRSLVETMNGTIFVDSVKNQGTTFTIEFLAA